MLTRQNGVDLESSGKIENVRERSLQNKKNNNKTKQNNKKITNNPNWMMGNRQENNGGRFILWGYVAEKLKNSRLERI